MCIDIPFHAGTPIDKTLFVHFCPLAQSGNGVTGPLVITVAKSASLTAGDGVVHNVA